jgi:hypothetical protein
LFHYDFVLILFFIFPFFVSVLAQQTKTGPWFESVLWLLGSFDCANEGVFSKLNGSNHHSLVFGALTWASAIGIAFRLGVGLVAAEEHVFGYSKEILGYETGSLGIARELVLLLCVIPSNFKFWWHSWAFRTASEVTQLGEVFFNLVSCRLFCRTTFYG